MTSSKKKKPPVKLKFNKGIHTIIKDYEKYKFPTGGYVEIGSNPWNVNMLKELVGDWKEVETKDPIKEWVERWLENEKSNSRI